MDEEIGVMLISIIIGLVILLIVREIVCWYWKINRAIYSLENIESLLETISDQLGNIEVEPEEESEVIYQDKSIISDGKTRCPKCGTPYEISDYRKDVEEIYCSVCKTQLK